jgi:hypothetical protein
MKPMRIKLTAFIIVSFLAFSACTEKDIVEDTNPPADSKPNTVSGIVLDTKGQPVANAKVRAENTALSTGAYVDGKTDNNGRYTLPLASLGGWTVFAWKDVTDVDGQVYHVRIAGATDADYEPFTPGQNTVVRNFKWKLTGIIPDRSQAPDYSFGYFGGSLDFVNAHFKDGNDAATEMPAGTKITVTLTPVDGATYLDGSAATEAISKTFTISERVPRDVNFYIGDIPVTKYTVTARTSAGRPVYLGRNKFNYNDHTPEADVMFFPSPGSSGTYESGVGVGAAVNFPYYMSER